MALKYVDIEGKCERLAKAMTDFKPPEGLPPEAYAMIEAQRSASHLMAAQMRWYMEQANAGTKPTDIMVGLIYAFANALYPFLAELGDDIGCPPMYDDHLHSLIHTIPGAIGAALHENWRMDLGDDVDGVAEGGEGEDLHRVDVQ